MSVWPRVWALASTGFVADTNVLQGEDHKDYHLALPEVPTKVEKTQENCVIPNLVDLDEEGLAVIENGCVTKDDSNFRRLQFLFWKKLDRNQRVLVLAELGMLPDDFQMQPVWLRRGLDAARYQGKLCELWDSVMRYLPEDQKETNPFLS